MPKYKGIRDYENKITDEKRKCPYCNNTQLIEFGTRRNKLNAKQKFKCKKCERTFTPHDFSFGRKYSEKTIIEVLELHYKVRSAKASKEFNIPRQTILNWSKEFVVVNNKLRPKKEYNEELKKKKELEKLAYPER